METIQMLGSLGEFVGAIAVVATLVYLAIQVRHSKEAIEANTRSMDESRQAMIAQTFQARAYRTYSFSSDSARILMKSCRLRGMVDTTHH